MERGCSTDVWRNGTADGPWDPEARPRGGCSAPDPPRLFPQVIPASARLHKPLLNMRHSLHLTFMCLSLFTGR